MNCSDMGHLRLRGVQLCASLHFTLTSEEGNVTRQRASELDGDGAGMVGDRPAGRGRVRDEGAALCEQLVDYSAVRAVTGAEVEHHRGAV